MRRKKLYRKLVHEVPHQLFSDQRRDDFRLWLDGIRGKKPLILEIGMGTGDFLVKQAAEHPELFFLGIEVKPDRIYQAYAKAEEQKLLNIAFLQAKAERMAEFHLPSVRTIYLLFSDPWPKKAHMIRRLSSERYLLLYEGLLEPNGELILKTDNEVLFDYSLESFTKRGWKILEQDRDFQTPLEEQTKYEKKFRAEKKPIFYMKAAFI